MRVGICTGQMPTYVGVVRGASTLMRKWQKQALTVVSFIYNLLPTKHLYIRTGDLKLFVNAVKSVTLDSGFDIPTEKAQIARLTAERLLKYFETNEVQTVQFSETLISRISTCCTHNKAVTCRKLKERMWETFYKLCSEDDFRSMWMTFIQTSIGFTGSPIFYVYVTRAILDDLVKLQFPVDDPSCCNSQASSPDFAELNALRYCGGYLVRSLKNKVKASASPLKKELLLCLDDLVEGMLTSKLHDKCFMTKNVFLFQIIVAPPIRKNG